MADETITPSEKRPAGDLTCVAVALAVEKYDTAARAAQQAEAVARATLAQTMELIAQKSAGADGVAAADGWQLTTGGEWWRVPTPSAAPNDPTSPPALTLVK